MNSLFIKLLNYLNHLNHLKRCDGFYGSLGQGHKAGSYSLIMFYTNSKLILSKKKSFINFLSIKCDSLVYLFLVDNIGWYARVS